MSFDPNPDLYDYAVPPNVYPACFNLGKSPESVFINVSGIKIGAIWGPVDPEPPNGNFEISAFAPCRWKQFIAPWEFDYRLFVGQSLLFIWDIGLHFPFTSNPQTDCTLWFDAFQQDPGAKYYSGQAIVTPPLPGGSFSEIELLDLVGLDTIKQTWANPRAAADEISFHTISRRFDSTNIKIKFDHA